MNNFNSTRRHHWSWRNCFAFVKYNKKSNKQHNHQSKLTSNGLTNYSHIQNENHLNNQHNDEYHNSSSCIIKIDEPSNENDTHLIDEDSIEQVMFDQMNSSIDNQQLTSILRSTHLDAIVEDSNEESSDECDETIQRGRLCSDREIINDSNDLHSRLFDLSKMNHVVTQFHENGNLLGEFIRQIDKLKIKTNDIVRVSTQMPRDAELLEARYSTLLASIESLSLLLKISQIPACRSLINRLTISIEQRTQQLQKLIELTSIPLINICQLRRDIYDDDHLSFRSALSSYEHLFPTSSSSS